MIRKFSISARPLRNTKPTGCCIKEFATRIQNADKLVPNATNVATVACALLDKRPQPKIQTPINVDSKKNAINASRASGAPKISPIKREYSAQFIPKWNS